MKELAELMSPSEYLLIPIGIFIGFAITALFQGAIRVYQNWYYIEKPYDLMHAAWTVMLFLGILEYWWASYESLFFISKDFGSYFLYCFPSLSAYAVTGILFPMDYNKEFFNNYFIQFMEKKRRALYIALLFYLGSIYFIPVPSSESLISVLKWIRFGLIFVVTFGLFADFKFKGKLKPIVPKENATSENTNLKRKGFIKIEYVEDRNYTLKGIIDLVILFLTCVVLIIFLSARFIDFENNNPGSINSAKQQTQVTRIDSTAKSPSTMPSSESSLTLPKVR